MFNYDQSLPGLDQLIETPRGPTVRQAGKTDRIMNGSSIVNNSVKHSRWHEQGVQTDPPSQILQANSSSSSSSISSSSARSSSSSVDSSVANLATNTNSNSNSNNNNNNSSSSWPLLPAAVATQTASEQVKKQQHQQQRNGGCILLLNSLPQVVNNSALVRQRASAKDCLAAASVNAGASVPLMAGGGGGGGRMLECLPDCPTNLASTYNLEQQPKSVAAVSTAASNLVPKNTALRAEQRKQNHAVSVVRPVVSMVNNTNNINNNNHHHHLQPIVVNPIRGSNMRSRLEDPSPIWSQQQTGGIQNRQAGSLSILDEFMMLDRQIRQQPAASDYSNCDASQIDLEDHMLSQKTRGLGLLSGCKQQQQQQQLQLQAADQFGEQQARQQAALFRREEFELNRTIRRQHRFLLAKLEERKRGLQIVQAVWFQKGFKEAIERLVDIYHQGLIFTATATNQVAAGGLDFDQDDDNGGGELFEETTMDPQKQPSTRQQFIGNRRQGTATSASAILNSLNTSLVVDVLGIIILRPKLWNLEICQLLLPIINNDLMMQNKQGYENYLEVALKAVKLILTNFSSVIITTLLDSIEKDGGTKTLVGVNLNREDRLNKCLNCFKLLLETRSIIRGTAGQQQNRAPSSNNGCNLVAGGGDRTSFKHIYRELDQLFATFESSMDPAQIGSLLRR